MATVILTAFKAAKMRDARYLATVISRSLLLSSQSRGNSTTDVSVWLPWFVFLAKRYLFGHVKVKQQRHCYVVMFHQL